MSYFLVLYLDLALGSSVYSLHFGRIGKHQQTEIYFDFKVALSLCVAMSYRATVSTSPRSTLDWAWNLLFEVSEDVFIVTTDNELCMIVFSTCINSFAICFLKTLACNMISVNLCIVLSLFIVFLVTHHTSVVVMNSKFIASGTTLYNWTRQ